MNEIENGKPLVLITGSAGFIGTRTIGELIGEYTVVGLDIERPEKEVAGSHFIECDLTREESVNDAFETIRAQFGDKIAGVIHLAAFYDFSGEASDMYENLTVRGTARLLTKLREFETEQFVFSSSMLVYEPVAEGEKLTEDSRLEDEPWAYPQSKIDAEAAIETVRGRIPTVVLRIAGVYSDECHSIPIAQQIKRIYEEEFESHFFPGDVSHGQAFLHVDDLADCFKRVVGRRRELGDEMFLIGEPDVMSYEELQNQIAVLIHGEEWTTVRIPKFLARIGARLQEQIEGEDETFIKPWMIEFADAHYPVDITHAREELGWTPERRMRDTLPEMIGRLKKDPREWYRKNGLEFPEELEEQAERTAGNG
jgi:dihydroflavonol-4-reductase